MSALMSIKVGGTIQLFTDGASYEPDGTIVSFVRKVLVGKKTAVAIGIRGFGRLALDAACNLVNTADEVGPEAFLVHLENIAGQLQEISSSLPRESQFQYMIALGQPGKGVRHLGLHCVPEFSAMPYCQLVELGDLTASGSHFTAAELFQRGILPARGDPTQWARTCGLQIMEMMRSRPAERLPGYEGGHDYVIGGHVDLATVTERRATVQRIRVWPDKVGEKIDPAARSNVVAFPQNRRERRRSAGNIKATQKRA